MAEKYLTEGNFKNILNGIQGKIPKELEVNINTNVNRTEIDILDSPTIILKYGTFGEATVTLTRDWTGFDMLEIDTEYLVPGGSAYYDTFMVSTKALNNSAILSTSSPSKFCTTIHCTNAAIGDANTTTSNLKYYYKATIVSYSDTATSLKFMGSVGSTGSVTGTTITILAIRGINYTQSFGDTPLGTIISYMGITPPDEYLACDGTTYLINQYWELAEFIKTQFGTYNHFGGNGTTTFAVPDLRGEFLRMTGTNGHTNQGNGASVGVHQDGTSFPNITTYSLSFYKIREQSELSSQASNVDSGIGQRYDALKITGSVESGASTQVAKYTSRPTNTSVLYCIKYTNSPSMQPSNVYSTEEKRIGTWIDGKPLYQTTVQFTTPSITGTQPYSFIPSVPWNDIDTFIGSDGVVLRSDGYTVENRFYYNNNNMFSFHFNKTSGNIFFYVDGTPTTAGRPAIMTFRYTKI